MPDRKLGDVEIFERYDQENDVYYVTLKTGEPSYCVEVDDVILLEVGHFSGLPTGFRILNMSRFVREPVSYDEIKRKLLEAYHDLSKPTVADREQALTQTLDRVLV